MSCHYNRASLKTEKKDKSRVCFMGTIIEKSCAIRRKESNDARIVRARIVFARSFK